MFVFEETRCLSEAPKGAIGTRDGPVTNLEVIERFSSGQE